MDRANEVISVTIGGVNYLVKQDSVEVDPSSEYEEEIEGSPLTRTVRCNGEASMTILVSSTTDLDTLRNAQGTTLQIDYGNKLYVSDNVRRVGKFPHKINGAEVDVKYIGSIKKVDA